MITVYILAVAAAIMQCHFSLTVLLLVLLKKIQGISLSLNGVDMPNNSRISLDSIGRNLNKALICHTDDESGDWYYPNGKIVPSQANLGLDSTMKLRITISFYTYQGNGLVHLYREGVPSLLGQFMCKTSRINTRVFVTIRYQGVFLSLRGVTIPNNTFVDVADIGGKNSDKEGLFCHTDRFEHGRILQLSSADWHFPNGSRVWNYKDFDVAYGSVPTNTFQRNTAYGLIRLITAGSPPERGQFYCIIPDAAGTIQTLYVNIVDTLLCNGADNSHNNYDVITAATGTVAFNSTTTTCSEDHCSCMIGHMVWTTVTLLVLVLALIIAAAFFITRHRCKSRYQGQLSGGYYTLLRDSQGPPPLPPPRDLRCATVTQQSTVISAGTQLPPHEESAVQKNDSYPETQSSCDISSKSSASGAEPSPVLCGTNEQVHQSSPHNILQEHTSFPLALTTDQRHSKSASSMYEQIRPYERIHHNITSRYRNSKESD